MEMPQIKMFSDSYDLKIEPITLMLSQNLDTTFTLAGVSMHASY